MFQAYKDRVALKRWQKSALGSALRDHGAASFWSESAPLSWFDDAEKTRHCIELHAIGMNIASSENPILSARAEMSRFVNDAAILSVISMTENAKLEHELFADSPFISGKLLQYIESVVEHLDELAKLRFDDAGLPTKDVASYCANRANLMLIYSNAMNLISIYLEQRANDPSEWYRAFMQSAMIVAEDGIRQKIKRPSLLPSPVASLVYSSFNDYVLSGEPDPFFKWCQSFPNYYLWKRGTKAA